MPVAADAQEVNLYTTREPGLIQPLMDSFTKSTGIKVNSIFIKDGLAERVAAEGAQSPADVLMTVDFGALLDLIDKGLTQPVQSAVLERRCRPTFAAKGRVVCALAARASRLCAEGARTDVVHLRAAGRPAVEGQGLHARRPASLQHGAHRRLHRASWRGGCGDLAARRQANLARAATGGDREVARDIMGGICDIAVANSYYVGLMRSGTGGPEQRSGGRPSMSCCRRSGRAARRSTCPAHRSRSTRRTAPTRPLLEYLVSDEAQKLYAEVNYEYPGQGRRADHPIIAALGP